MTAARTVLSRHVTLRSARRASEEWEWALASCGFHCRVHIRRQHGAWFRRHAVVARWL